MARLRHSQGLTGADLAARVGMSQPKISRLERGVAVPDPEDVRRIARALGASEREANSLVERAERPHSHMTDWRPEAGGLATRQVSVARWEATAREIRDFEPAVVPGLLQTSGYARAMLLGFQQLHEIDTPDEAHRAVPAAVTERIRRQEILTDTAKSFHIVFTETVLSYAICPPTEMIAQIGRVREVARQDNVDLRVITADTSIAIPPVHGFVLFDDTMVVVDAFNTGLISRSRKDTRSYRRVFDLFENSAGAVDPTLDKYEELYVRRLRG
ncbi:helix-turn-helix domain-containing protein [Symbioplanes lichenis]|uniref:helix-turn-helix domain-containing protein n=1 Tax=Symbioplanes lichenis TaxID=1629072 RepID=UPI00273909E5|nr:helix-turn-helix transcriptional regulator [Actinoplanes lichenis]